MKSTISCFLVLVCCSLLLYQEGEAEDVLDRKGSKAICFGFDGLDLSSFRGGVGGKYWLANDWAAQGSVRVLFSEDEETNQEKTESSQTEVNLWSGLEKHVRRGRISPYIGAALGVGLSNTSYSRPERERDYTRLSFSAGLALGVEYWPLERISLAGEHTLSGVYTRDWRIDRRTDDSEDLDTSSIEIRSGTSYLILSLYF